MCWYIILFNWNLTKFRVYDALYRYTEIVTAAWIYAKCIFRNTCTVHVPTTQSSMRDTHLFAIE